MGGKAVAIGVKQVFSHMLPSLQEEAFSRLNDLLTNEQNPVAVNGDSGKKVKKMNPL
jgi:hypothetical protein